MTNTTERTLNVAVVINRPCQNITLTENISSESKTSDVVTLDLLRKT